MTSLVLFKSDCSENHEPVKPSRDWGTGKARTRGSKSAVPRLSGIFLHSGEPVSQTYRNTDLTLSNLRNNDELVPAPLHTTDIASHQIPLEFPSNHPYTSHISEKAVFPTATTGLNDRPSTSVEPYIVTHKIRGNPFRREVHYHGWQRARFQTSKWPDKHYMHLPRSLSDVNSSSIYPWPRTMLSPNNENLLQNTTTKLSKRVSSRTVHDAKATANKQPKSHLNKTSESARPTTSMQPTHIHGNRQQPRAFEKQNTSTYQSPMQATRLMNENERLDDQMRNGTDYVNLPAHLFPPDLAPTWIPQQETTNDNNPNTPREIRFLQPARSATASGQLYGDHYASHQQMEAENRLRQLELIRPKENIDLLNVKYRHVQHPRHARPILPQYRDDYVNTFYDQMGSYVQERAGLYHTESYDPNVLPQSMPELANLQGNSSASTNENNPGDLVDRLEQNQNRGQPKLFQYKAMGDYETMRNRLLNKLSVSQDAGAVDGRTQEGDKPFIQRESVYGQSYNTRKFLQENTLSQHARIDPSGLMSTRYNNNLERVRSLNSSPMKATQNQTKTDNTLVSPCLYPPQYDDIYSTKNITEHTDGYYRRPTARVYDSPFQNEQHPSVHQLYQQQQQQQTASPRAQSFDPALQVPAQIPRSVKIDMRLPGPEPVARFIEPKFETRTTYQRSFKDITFREGEPQREDRMQENNQNFSQTSLNSPRDWKLTDIQNRWSKTQAQQQYQREHPEVMPYSSDTIMRAKKEVILADSIAKQQMMTVR